jgi:hypothetical protein
VQVAISETDGWLVGAPCIRVAAGPPDAAPLGGVKCLGVAIGVVVTLRGNQRDCEGADYSGLWQTASMLFPSGSKTYAP